MKEYIISLLSKDREGIIRDSSKIVSDNGGNIIKLSQTVVDDYFTVIMAITAPDSLCPNTLEQAITKSGSEGEFHVNVIAKEKENLCEKTKSENYTLTMQGLDQKGIIAKTTEYLASQKINIEDFYSYVHDKKLLMISQISVPSGINVDDIRSNLEDVGKEFGLIVHLQHENIFKATTEIKPVLDIH